MQSQIQAQMQVLPTPERPAACTVHRYQGDIASRYHYTTTLVSRPDLQHPPPPVTVGSQCPALVASYLTPAVDDQPDADSGDRRHTQGHQWVVAATSKEPAALSVAIS